MELLYDIVTELFLLFVLPFQLMNVLQVKNTELVALLKSQPANQGKNSFTVNYSLYSIYSRI